MRKKSPTNQKFLEIGYKSEFALCLYSLVEYFLLHFVLLLFQTQTKKKLKYNQKNS